MFTIPLVRNPQIHTHQTTPHLSIPMNNESYDFDDDKEAVKFHRLYAEQGDAEAQFNLGQMYREGLEVAQNYKEAVKWYRLSAEQGDAVAQFNLGFMYGKGLGVPQDYVSAHMWWNLSDSNGHKSAVKNRNIVEKKMSKQQIEKAQELARNWKPTTK